MSASLVGSEMCIRDSVNAVAEELILGCIDCAKDHGLSPKDPAYPIVQLAVSYTHLTLPTICSV
eukprot:2929735-Alexandrium_andersonii.AAC.1